MITTAQFVFRFPFIQRYSRLFLSLRVRLLRGIGSVTKQQIATGERGWHTAIQRGLFKAVFGMQIRSAIQMGLFPLGVCLASPWLWLPGGGMEVMVQ